MAENNLPVDKSLTELMQAAITADSLETLARQVLPLLAGDLALPGAFLFIDDPRLSLPFVFHHGIQGEAADEADRQSAGALAQRDNWVGPLELTAPPPLGRLALYPLGQSAGIFGCLGFLSREDFNPAGLSGKALQILAITIDRLVENVKTARQLLHLNTYMSVSSMLAQSIAINELVEGALYSAMDAVSAEAASVLLLDEGKQNFIFYQVEGASQPLLKAETFPADRGIAGRVLETGIAEVVNDVGRDSRFYKDIDSKTGFGTRNMIVVPLVAGDEKIGVLEVLNKAGDARFSEEDRLLLCSIAEEIAFAIRNAKLFEYVANSYCRQRQGETSCKGCKRPLGSWTPCLKYREVTPLP